MKRIFRFCMYFLALLWVIPLLWLIWTAIRPSQLATSLSFSVDFTLDNFIDAWQKAPFAQYYLNTFYIVFGILIVQLITATLAAYVFARLNFWGKKVIFILILVQLMIPIDVLIFPNYNVLRDLSLLNTKLGIMIPYFATAFGIFLLRQRFKSVPYELEEVAKLEGCGILETIWKVYVPLAKPTYIAFGLVSVSYHWSSFLWPLIVTDSAQNRPLTVGLSLFAQSFETGAQWAEVSAATFMVIFPLLLAFFIFQKEFISSFMQSGIK
ncbi:sn-glycerol 3-phosphate transport system permease protein [Orenia metallireducens]|uniref:sn-glycerol 3-phosphate transport system permease protein n=2 Tax=Orenia metallireducens TaxID=1413210 RepID=A0A285IH64_9FIRM|nr:carbohydrate ABC transporter permease [Orenia metallireducens]PRX17785.1 sn-glycerol 3-phosphate transport system permease protein [Orenia metallireducens]SNY47325.1 sn-glycerol 3-phosphate transport system permease protein [Orenia metallireducens]